MKRPCADEHPRPHITAPRCRLCWLAVNDAAYAKLFGMPGARTKPCCWKGETLRGEDGRARTKEIATGYG